MLFFSAILLSLVQFAFLAYDPNDPCFYGLTYCLNRDGSTNCTADTVARVTLGVSHTDAYERLSLSLLAYHSKGPKPVTLSLGFNVKGIDYTLYCPSDGDKTYKPAGMDAVWAYYDFSCSWYLALRADQDSPLAVTNSSISIDLATIDDNVPITLGFNEVKAVVAPNLKGSLVHQLKYLECYEENRMSFTDNDKKNRVMLMKNVHKMETFVFGLTPDQKPVDRSVKFVNSDGVSLTVSCNKSFDSLTGFIQKGDKKESIDDLFTFKSLSGYRCGFKLPLVVQTKNIKFDFESKPLDFSFSSTLGSSIKKQNILFNTDKRSTTWVALDKIDWDNYNPEDK